MARLEHAIVAELDDNPALETIDMASDAASEKATDTDVEPASSSDDEAYERLTEREERENALEAALESIGADDRMDEPTPGNTRYTPEAGTYMETRSEMSFYDMLHQQMGEHTLTNTQREIMEYLIGSLDNDGLLRKSAEQISDEMAIYHNIDVSTQQINDVLTILQTFDPPGIGASSLQQCLLLQVSRMENDMKQTAEVVTDDAALARRHDLLAQMRHVLTAHFDAFMKNQWNKISASMHLTEEDSNELHAALRRLNPKPGFTLGELSARSTQQITPDFVVDDEGDGTLRVSLNRGELPELYISPMFAEMMTAYRENRNAMNRAEKEALLYSREKVNRAKGFINAIEQRNNTLLLTMRTIVEWQHSFFADGEQSLLRPMILKDISEQTGLSIATVSRACSEKFVQTRWGTFPLRHFFSDVYTTDEGDELSKHKIKSMLRQLIDEEDKHSPLSDDTLQKMMKDKGYPIARRTIAKYRAAMGIPVARLRRQM